MGANLTLEENPSAQRRRVRVLTLVLSSDDLCTDVTRRWRIDRPRPISIGRAGDDGPSGFRAPGELRLADGFASGGHAELDAAGGADVIRDLASRNGTWVNGKRIDEHRLADGDLIEIGHSLLCYRVIDEGAFELLERGGEALRLGPVRTHNAETATILGDLDRIAASRESVLVLGETGAGKEVIASEVHRRSGRKGAFVTIDCGAVPESLFESTFFGHRKGAFTGASEARAGEISRADGGTLFLDEVGNMSAAAQAKLLRVIEDGKVTPLGASEPQTVDVRWMAATNADLFDEGAGFRADLLRRLAGYVARLPPLRRRREDLGVLAAHLLRDAGVKKQAMTAAAARRLFCGELAGNVRELRAALRSAALLAAGAAIDLPHLPAEPSSPVPHESDDSPSSDTMAGARAAGTPSASELEAAIESTGGNVVRAAKLLNTHPRQLYRWIEKFGLSLEKYRKR